MRPRGLLLPLLALSVLGLARASGVFSVGNMTVEGRVASLADFSNRKLPDLLSILPEGRCFRLYLNAGPGKTVLGVPATSEVVLEAPLERDLCPAADIAKSRSRGSVGHAGAQGELDDLVILQLKALDFSRNGKVDVLVSLGPRDYSPSAPSPAPQVHNVLYLQVGEEESTYGTGSHEKIFPPGSSINFYLPVVLENTVDLPVPLAVTKQGAPDLLVRGDGAKEIRVLKNMLCDYTASPAGVLACLQDASSCFVESYRLTTEWDLAYPLEVSMVDLEGSCIPQLAIRTARLCGWGEEGAPEYLVSQIDTVRAAYQAPGSFPEAADPAEFWADDEVCAFLEIYEMDFDSNMYIPYTSEGVPKIFALGPGASYLGLVDANTNAATDIMFSVCRGERCSVESSVHVLFNRQIPTCQGTGSTSTCRGKQDLCKADRGFRFNSDISDVMIYSIRGEITLQNGEEGEPGALRDSGEPGGPGEPEESGEPGEPRDLPDPLDPVEPGKPEVVPFTVSSSADDEGGKPPRIAVEDVYLQRLPTIFVPIVMRRGNVGPSEVTHTILPFDLTPCGDVEECPQHLRDHSALDAVLYPVPSRLKIDGIPNFVVEEGGEGGNMDESVGGAEGHTKSAEASPNASCQVGECIPANASPSHFRLRVTRAGNEAAFHGTSNVPNTAVASDASDAPFPVRDVAAVDFQGTGRQELIFVSPAGTRFLHNRVESSGFFARAYLLSDLCFESCRGADPSWSTRYYTTSLPGAALKYVTSDPSNLPKAGIATLLGSPCGHELDKPYAFWGISVVAQYIDSFYAGHILGRDRSHCWRMASGLVPNSGIVLVPYPTNDPDAWVVQAFLSNSLQAELEVVIIFAGIFVLVLLLALVAAYVRMRRMRKAAGDEGAQGRPRFSRRRR